MGLQGTITAKEQLQRNKHQLSQRKRWIDCHQGVLEQDMQKFLKKKLIGFKKEKERKEKNQKRYQLQTVHKTQNQQV